MKEGLDLRNFFVQSVTIHLVSARFETVARFEGVARYLYRYKKQTIGELKMEEYGTLHAEPIKVGKYKGHKYFVNMSQFLWLNGYAEIPENWKDGEEDYIDVHGGVTFKGYLINGGEKVRVIGFGTMHLGDSPAYWNLCRVEKECKHLIDGIIEVMED